MKVEGEPKRARLAALRYGAAVLLVGMATVVRFPLQGFLGSDVPFLLYFPAVLAAAWYGGLGPGILAAILSAIASKFFWMNPQGAFNFSRQALIQLALFLAVTIFISWLIERFHHSLRRLESARHRIAQILSSITDGFSILDHDWRFIYANDRGVEIARRPREELLGNRLWDLYPEDVESAGYGELHKAMRDSVPVHYETFYKPFQAWFEVRAYPVEEGLALYVADITEKKNIELAVTRELEEQVTEKTHELAERNRSLEALTQTLAHDLRAPLRAVNGLTSILQEEYADRLDKTGQDYCRRIVAAGNHAEQMMADLLEFARLTHANLPKESLPLDGIVTRVLDRLQDDILAAGAKVEVKRPLPGVLANQTVLEQALTNLVSNALKFRREDVAPRVRIEAEQRNGEVKLCVMDNGTGIPAEGMDRLFKPFQRMTNARPGTGLGLSIVKKGVERMGGHVGVKSTEGQGSSFWISLPVAN